jgi:hypothetical protein
MVHFQVKYDKASDECTEISDSDLTSDLRPADCQSAKAVPFITDFLVLHPFMLVSSVLDITAKCDTAIIVLFH